MSELSHQYNPRQNQFGFPHISFYFCYFVLYCVFMFLYFSSCENNLFKYLEVESQLEGLEKPSLALISMTWHVFGNKGNCNSISRLWGPDHVQVNWEPGLSSDWLTCYVNQSQTWFSIELHIIRLFILIYM